MTYPWSTRCINSVDQLIWSSSNYFVTHLLQELFCIKMQNNSWSARSRSHFLIQLWIQKGAPRERYRYIRSCALPWCTDLAWPFIGVRAQVLNPSGTGPVQDLRGYSMDVVTRSHVTTSNYFVTRLLQELFCIKMQNNYWSARSRSHFLIQDALMRSSQNTPHMGTAKWAPLFGTLLE